MREQGQALLGLAVLERETAETRRLTQLQRRCLLDLGLWSLGYARADCLLVGRAFLLGQLLAGVEELERLRSKKGERARQRENQTSFRTAPPSTDHPIPLTKLHLPALLHWGLRAFSP